ncbi:fosfomycin resistance glutathione transferase [Enterovibrio calviensis]|uniref:fosfomycin resistance glutathione transferase n=1 Tax=Enterovibrio calviensis TaxID=91359 RepID=UPI0004833E36|nr:fosfomycin resistance glutathione transferase [Enterovibrio calviensis]
MLRGINHVTLAVSNLDASLKFYIGHLGFTGHVRWNTGAYLTLGDFWLCLSVDEPCDKSDYTHLALDIDEQAFDVMADKLRASGVKEWKDNRSEGRSIYILDPDGHKLEVHTGGLSQRLKSLKKKPYEGLIWL